MSILSNGGSASVPPAIVRLLHHLCQTGVSLVQVESSGSVSTCQVRRFPLDLVGQAAPAVVLAAICQPIELSTASHRVTWAARSGISGSCFVRAGRLTAGPVLTGTAISGTAISGTVVSDASPVNPEAEILLGRLGVPGPEPAVNTGWFWAAAWMLILARAGSGLALGRTISAAQAAGLHPARGEGPHTAPVVGPSGAVGVSGIQSSTVQSHRAHVEANDWEVLRVEAISGELPAGNCQPELASWLANGAFSRWVGRSLPRPDTVVPVLLGTLDHEAQLLVGAVLSDVLLGRRWPPLARLLDLTILGSELPDSPRGDPRFSQPLAQYLHQTDLL